MKKTIACLLTVFLLFGCFSLCAFAETAKPLRFAAASDLHYNLPEETLTWLTDDPVFGYANRRAAMENESGFLIDSFLGDAAENGVDCVLISGDLADNGRSIPAEHYAVRDKLLDFEKRTGIEVFVIDGNHDLGENSETDIAAFKRIYADLGYDHALSTREDDCSYTADLGESVRLIALDSCDPTKSTEDGMSLFKVRWVLEQAKQAKADGREPLLMMHHNLLDHLPAQRLFSRNFIVRFHYSTAALFADAGIRVVLTGHEHCSDAAVYRSPGLNVIRDFATTSLTMYPLSYRVFTFDRNTVTYEARTLSSLDTSALSAAVSGYTEEQLSRMNADLDAYAKAFLKAGVTYRLSRSLTASASDLKEGTVLYGLLDSLYAHLKTVLSMPMDEAISLAASFGIDVPQTGRKNGWDLATDFVAAHYAGSERFSLDSDEVQALLRLASLILKYVPAGVTEDAFSSLTAFIADSDALSSAKALARRVFGRVSPGEVLVAVLVSDLVYGFTNDADGLDDNNGSFMLDETKGNTFLQKWTALWERFARLFKNLIALLGFTAA